MEHFRNITPEQRQYVLDHINDHPRTAVAKAAGICASTLYRIVRENGGDIDHTKSLPNNKCKEAVLKLWPRYSAREIHSMTGFTYSRIIAWKTRLGLEHDEETRLRLEKKCYDARMEGRKKVNQAARAAVWKKRRKLDELRYMSGMETKTKFRHKRWPKKTYKAIFHLTKHLDYFLDEEVGGDYTLFYDEETKRSPFEQHYIEKYRLKFQQA